MENIHCEENNQEKALLLDTLNSQESVPDLGLECQQVWCTINISDILQVEEWIPQQQKKYS